MHLRFPTLVLACLPLFTATVSAQAPGAWSSLVVPRGVNPSGISQRGKVIAYQDGSRVYAWSSATRSFASVPASTSATLSYANDIVLVQDGGRFAAFASYSGEFATVNLSSSASVLNSPANRNDSIVLVLDGTDLWAFSGFAGQWIKKTIAPSAHVAVQRHVAVVGNGNEVLAMSAFRSRWIAQPLQGPLTRVGADGTVGIAEAGGQVHGFSALRESWHAMAAPSANATLHLDDDLAIWSDAVQVLAFSGLRGSFATAVIGAPSQVSTGDQVALAVSGNDHWLLAAPTGTWTRVSLATAPRAVLEASLIVLQDASTVHCFGAVAGTVATWRGASTRLATSPTVAEVRDASGGGALFSALTGTWTALPASLTGNDVVALGSTGALVPVPGGHAAFSARTGSYHTLPTTPTSRAFVEAQSAIMAVVDTRSLHVFDARRAAWTTAPVSDGSTLAVRFWRTALVAIDGSRALGFGSMHGRIDTVPLGGPMVEFAANSESARVTTATSLFAYSTTPLLSTPWQFPEFRRTFVGGAMLDLHLAGVRAQGIAFLAAGVTTPFELPGLGTLYLDPRLLSNATLSLDARSGTSGIAVAVPDHPALRGIEVFAQALVLPITGAPFVSELASVRVH
ncbi:MAG: hypothetical protein H6836_04450 [Planctomycetes bacterium]|nr:hypothetical protein [Planctomycetota bacterium]